MDAFRAARVLSKPGMKSTGRARKALIRGSKLAARPRMLGSGLSSSRETALSGPEKPLRRRGSFKYEIHVAGESPGDVGLSVEVRHRSKKCREMQMEVNPTSRRSLGG